MMIELSTGNLLKADAEALVNTVNTEGVMGKGIALQFKNAYPEMFRVYADACKVGGIQLGRVQVFDLGGIGEGPRWIVNFPTKGHWRSRSRLEDVATGLNDLVETVQRLGIGSIAVPPLGCGNGGLDWASVQPLIEQAFAALPQVTVKLYAPSGSPVAADMPNNTVKPKLTTGAATLLLLMHRYLQGLLDPFVSLLEMQKLMYFMQEAGQPLKLKYQADTYGPYAPNLAHVLKRLEGHYILGFGDGASQPDKPLELVPDVVDEAYAKLARDDETMKRLDQVTKLIDGFEDSYGMELLSTMLWVMVASKDAREHLEVAIRAVQSWSTRKRRILKPNHLEKAWQRLKEQEWDFSAHSIVNSHCGESFNSRIEVLLARRSSRLEPNQRGRRLNGCRLANPKIV